MARIRTIKPQFWSTPGIETLDPMWRLLYVAMWNWADDYGRGTAEARELMGFVFPRDEDMTLEEFRRGLGGIRRVFGVEFYTVGGRSYYSIPTWEKHQKIDKRSKFQHPGPEEGEPYDPEVKPQVRASIGGHSEEPAEYSEESGSRNKEVGIEEVGSNNTSEVASDDSDAANVLPLKAEIIERPDVEQLLDQLDEQIEANGNRKPNRNKKNHDAMRLLLDRDGYTPEQVSYIIDWAQASNFWQANVLSAAKLREKFTQLVAQARRDSKRKPTKAEETAWAVSPENTFVPAWARS